MAVQNLYVVETSEGVDSIHSSVKKAFNRVIVIFKEGCQLCIEEIVSEGVNCKWVFTPVDLAQVKKTIKEKFHIELFRVEGDLSKAPVNSPRVTISHRTLL